MDRPKLAQVPGLALVPGPAQEQEQEQEQEPAREQESPPGRKDHRTAARESAEQGWVLGLGRESVLEQEWGLALAQVRESVPARESEQASEQASARESELEPVPAAGQPPVARAWAPGSAVWSAWEPASDWGRVLVERVPPE